MARRTLNVHLLVDAGREADCAAALHQQLPPDQFRTLCQLAAELVSRWETAHSGHRIVVVQAADPAADIAKHLRLRPAAAVPPE